MRRWLSPPPRLDGSEGAVRAIPEAQGFGSRLFERGLARQFGGEVHLTFSAEGLRCTMDLPLGSQDPQARGELMGAR